jgi:hypothetical protein
MRDAFLREQLHEGGMAADRRGQGAMVHDGIL